MKRNILLFLCLVLFLTFTIETGVSADDSLTVRVGIYENRPKIFTDDQGNPSGFWADIVAYIASQEDWTVEYVHGTWAECLARLENNEIDMMPDVAYTEERAKKFGFSQEVVYSSWSLVYTRRGTDVQSILDLGGKSVAVMKDSVNYEGPQGIKKLAEAFDLDCNFVEADSYIKVFELVRDGEADVGVTSKDFGYQHEEVFGLVRTGILFAPSPLHFAFSEVSNLMPHLAERVDYHVREIKKDTGSVYYQALATWFGEMPVEKPVVPSWLIWALVGTGVLALLLTGGTLLLRHQVRVRTRELREEIAERRKAIERLVQYRQHLEEMVERRTAELAQKNLELQQANIRLQEVDRLKSVFLASMSHELRTPLNSVIGFSSIMLQGLAGELNEEQRKQLTIIKRSAYHLLNLINDVLDISKIEAGKVELSPEDIKLDELVKEVAEAFLPQAKEKNLELITEVPQGIVLHHDKRRVKQVLMNLVSNAIKFTYKGSVKIAAKVAGDGYVEMSVSDTGIGIKEEDMYKLFEPFQQIDTSLTKKHEGTGLGLYLSRKLADLLRGKISAESQYGQGSQFMFTLPLRYKSEG